MTDFEVEINGIHEKRRQAAELRHHAAILRKRGLEQLAEAAQLGEQASKRLLEIKGMLLELVPERAAEIQSAETIEPLRSIIDEAIAIGDN